MMGRKKGLLLAAAVLLGVIAATGTAVAQQAVSPSYMVNEVFFGTGGELEACSTAYCSKQSAGETAVGSSGSTNYSTQAGFNTNREEYIEFVVTNSGSDLGVLSASSASTAVGTFTVKTYLATGGYVVHTTSDPPSNTGSSPHTFVNLTSPTASSPGTEQFGINLVANTSPTTVGANPVQIPDNTFSFGAAATGYNTANQYKYVKGDVVAQSTVSSGQTNFTVTYLFNINPATQAGQYTFNHNLVATSTY